MIDTLKPNKEQAARVYIQEMRELKTKMNVCMKLLNRDAATQLAKLDVNAVKHQVVMAAQMCDKAKELKDTLFLVQKIDGNGNRQ